MSKKQIYIAIGVAAIGGVAYFYYRSKKDEPQPTTNVAGTEINVETAKVSSQEIKEVIKSEEQPPPKTVPAVIAGCRINDATGLWNAFKPNGDIDYTTGCGGSWGAPDKKFFVNGNWTQSWGWSQKN